MTDDRVIDSLATIPTSILERILAPETKDLSTIAMQHSFHMSLSETILFDGWRTTDWIGILGSAIGTILMAAIYEGLKNYREYLFIGASLARQAEGKNAKPPSMLSGLHLFQTCLQMIQIVLSYFLMLIFMTYNFWLCAAVTVGGALGYWLFAWQKASTDITECCH